MAKQEHDKSKDLPADAKNNRADLSAGGELGEWRQERDDFIRIFVNDNDKLSQEAKEALRKTVHSELGPWCDLENVLEVRLHTTKPRKIVIVSRYDDNGKEELAFSNIGF